MKLFSHDQMLINPKSYGLVHAGLGYTLLKFIIIIITIFCQTLTSAIITSNDTCISVESKLRWVQDRTLGVGDSM